MNGGWFMALLYQHYPIYIYLPLVGLVGLFVSNNAGATAGHHDEACVNIEDHDEVTRCGVKAGPEGMGPWEII